MFYTEIFKACSSSVSSSAVRMSSLLLSLWLRSTCWWIFPVQKKCCPPTRVHPSQPGNPALSSSSFDIYLPTTSHFSGASVQILFFCHALFCYYTFHAILFPYFNTNLQIYLFYIRKYDTKTIHISFGDMSTSSLSVKYVHNFIMEIASHKKHELHIKAPPLLQYNSDVH